MSELPVGEKRHFSFSEIIDINVKENNGKIKNRKVPVSYEIQEILLEPNISLMEIYDRGICPHCKEKISKNVQHIFYRIEILVKCDWNEKEQKWESKKDIKINDIILLGNTLDKRLLVLPKEKYKETFEKSKKFKEYLSGV